MGWHGGAVGGAGGRGNLRVAKTPPLQSAFAGKALGLSPHRPCQERDSQSCRLVEM